MIISLLLHRYDFGKQRKWTHFRRALESNASLFDAMGTVETIAGSFGNGGVLAGDYGAATSASLFFPQGISVSDSGIIYIADTFNNVVRKVQVQKSSSSKRSANSGGYIINTLGEGSFEPLQPTPAPAVSYYYSSLSSSSASSYYRYSSVHIACVVSIIICLIH